MASSSTTPPMLEDLYAKFSLDDENISGLSYAAELVESLAIDLR